MNPIGELIPADELFTHQIVDTFATVAPATRRGPRRCAPWPWPATAACRLGFGLGKYTNRDVMDAYAAVSRGVEQITVRASRELAPIPAPRPSARSTTR